jgi:LmbE family N-acetylglucosaminyl deacetylase
VALAVGAHPDDVEFGCGGTLAKWADAGCTVHHVVCTDGSKGTWDPAADTIALARLREAEQREAARRLSRARAGEVRFLRRVDGELEADRAAVADVVAAIRELRPDVVLGHDPWKRYRLHPDHRAAGVIVCDAIVAARDPHFLPGIGPAHHRPHALLLWEADVPSHVEDVSDHVITKLHALHAHESQFESTMGAVTPMQLAEFDDRIRSRLADLGASHGVVAAEIFAIISDL